MWLHEVRGMSPSSVGAILLVAERSVYRYPTPCNSTGSVRKEKKCGPNLLGDLEHFSILQFLIHKLILQLKEAQEKLLHTTGTWAHQSTIWCAIKEQGFTLNKVRMCSFCEKEYEFCERRYMFCERVYVFFL